MIRQCKLCKKYFSVDDPNSLQMCCSTSCETRLAELVELGEMNVTGLQMKKCASCGKLFQAWNSRKKYCSDECRTYESKRRQAVRRRGDAIPLKEIACRYCGQLFQPLSKKYQYCSETCRLEAKKLKSKHYRLQRKNMATTGSMHAEKVKSQPVPRPGHSKPVADKIAALEHINKRISIKLEDERIMKEWREGKQARKKWTKIPLEEAAAICKEYNLTYPQYQYMRAEGTLQEYIDKQEKKRKQGDN